MIKIFNMTILRRKLVLFMSFLLLMVGIYSYITIPKQEMPDLIVPMSVVQVVAPGVSTEEMEEITLNVETVFEHYVEVDNYTTITLDNVVIAQVFYDFSVKDTSEVSESIKLELLELEGERVSNVDVRTDLSIPHVVFSFSGSEIPNLEKEARQFKEEVLKIDNIYSAEIKSSLNTYLDVEVNQVFLDQISITDIYGIIYANAQSIPLGSIEGTPLKIDGSFDSVKDIEELYVNIYEDPETGYTIPITLADFAEISLKEYDGKEYYYNDEQTVFLEVYFNQNIDFSRTGQELTDVYNNYQSEIDITIMNYVPDYVDYQINQAMLSLLLCIVIVMAVVLIGLGFRNSIAIALTIPIIVFGTIFVIDLLGFELQRVSIAGIVISIGILVDNSIVISDAIQYYLDLGDNVYEASKKAIKTNSIAVLTSTLTTMAAFIPLTMLPGLAGQMAKSLPITVMVAIGLSYVFAIIVTPVIATFLFKPRKRKAMNFEWFKGVMRVVLKHPRTVVFISFATLLLMSFLVIQNQPIEIFPADEKSEFYIDFKASDNTKQSSRMLANEIIVVLDDYSEVEDYYYSIGGGLPAFSMTTQPINEVVEEGRFFVHTDLAFDEVKELTNSIQSELLLLDGDIQVNQIELGIASAPIEINVTSDNLDYLFKVMEQADLMLQENVKVKEYTVTQSSYYETFRLDVDRELLASTKTQMVELQNFIFTNLNGLKMEGYQYEGELVDIYVHSDFESLEELLDLRFKGYELNEFVDVYKDDALERIYKYNGGYLATLAVTPVGEDRLGLERDIMDFISLYNVEVSPGGDTELANTIFGDIGQAAIIAIVLIYLIMFIQFNSFQQPLIIFFTIPMSLIGSFIMMLLFDTPISLTSLLGIVSLIGVVVNTGILLVEYINKSIDEGKTKLEACVESVSRRFRPIVLASTTTILGLVPMIVSGGEFFSPLAIVFMGGILSTTVLTLFVVPSLYMIFVNEKHH